MVDEHKSLVEQLVSTKDGKRRFLQERAIRKATDLIEQLLLERDMGRAELAEELGRTKGWVTQLLDGDKNNTVRTIADVLAVLDMELDFSAKPFSMPHAHRCAYTMSFPWAASATGWPEVPQPTTNVLIAR